MALQRMALQRHKKESPCDAAITGDFGIRQGDSYVGMAMFMVRPVHRSYGSADQGQKHPRYRHD